MAFLPLMNPHLKNEGFVKPVNIEANISFHHLLTKHNAATRQSHCLGDQTSQNFPLLHAEEGKPASIP